MKLTYRRAQPVISKIDIKPKVFAQQSCGQSSQSSGILKINRAIATRVDRHASISQYFVRTYNDFNSGYLLASTAKSGRVLYLFSGCIQGERGQTHALEFVQ